jgi:transcriptional regulator with XRE-family HTH domain
MTTKSMRVSITVDVPTLEEILKEARMEHNWSQNELAFQMRALGIKITGQNIQKIEAGDTKVLPYETLEKLCQGLGIDLNSRLREHCLAQISFLTQK